MSFLWGFLYGFLCYSLFSYWLVNYSLLLFIIAVLFCAIILSILFSLMNCACKHSSYGIYVMALIWCVYEYLKTLGPFGFSYGILGYSQWKVPIMLTFSSVCGVWGGSFVCAYVSAFIASICIDYKQIKKILKKNIIHAIILVIIFLGITVYHFLKQNLQFKTVKVMTVQNNTDSNKNGLDVYKKDIRNLITLTDSKFSMEEKVDFVLWPETAVVPPIKYYYKNRIDHERFNIIVDMLSFIARKNACFVIGNQHSEKKSDGVFYDYNASLIFDSKSNNVIPPEPDIYKKIKLVPFSEYIPSNVFKNFSFFITEWKPGKNFSVFTNRNLCFCTPICFEDTFGNFCRKFVKNGAECFFELSNDSWARSSVCQRQHLSMSVFRSAENNVPAVRSSGSGVSCYITAQGSVVPEIIDEFSEGACIYSVNVPDNSHMTVYTAFGDWFPICETCFLLWLLIYTVLKYCINVEKNRKKG
ncbi:MAG: apolipoprotein N-acyltransferase [Treponema sp.]|nr:apolipoprotein N-acyltransferase [Treponema sp.]